MLHKGLFPSSSSAVPAKPLGDIMTDNVNPSNGTAMNDKNSNSRGGTGNNTGNSNQSRRDARIHDRAMRIAKAMETRRMTRMKDSEQGENKSWSSWRREQSLRECAKDDDGENIAPSTAVQKNQDDDNMNNDTSCTEENENMIETPFGEMELVVINQLVEAIRDGWHGTPPPHVPSQQQREVDIFFGGDADVHTDGHHMSVRRGLLYFHSISQLIEDEYEVHRTTNYTSGPEGERPCTFTEIQIGPKRTTEVLSHGVRYISHKETGRKFVVVVGPNDYDGDPEMTIIGDRNEGKANELWKDMLRWFHRQGPLKGQVVDARWNFINHVDVDLDDVVLDHKLRTTLEINVFEFLKRMDELEKRGLAASRGILISGPPGTGKTLFCTSIMANREDATVIYITSEDIERPSDIANAYRLARNLSPSIVIIEDIDTLGGIDRTQVHGHPLLGELLNSLSGAESNSGVITIATSNFAHSLDAALRDRPGRFDLMVELGPPDKKLREHLLRSAISRMGIIADFNISDFAKRCDGYTGAWLVELLTQALLLNHHYLGINTSKSKQQTKKALELAAKRTERFTTELMEEAFKLVEARREFARQGMDNFQHDKFTQNSQALYG